MRRRLFVGVVTFFVVVGVVLAVVLAGPDSLLSPVNVGNQPISQGIALHNGNTIVRENDHFGTSLWEIPQGKESSTQIQAYASKTSVSPGQKLTFYVSTQKEGTSYFIDFYRLGWYQGYGGRLMGSLGGLMGHAQGYYDSVTHHLVGCNSCLVDTKTGLVEANWRPSYTLAVPVDWTTGVYLAKFINANGMQTYVPFDVVGNSSSLYIAVTSDATYAAENEWGGYSFQNAYNSSGIGRSGRGVKVSFDRPYVRGDGSGDVLLFEINAIHWLERQGYDLSYISGVDLHVNPAQLLHHRAYISLGHDGYWTKEMRDGIEHARDSGVGLAFLEADAGHWQIRFEPDSKRAQNRTIVCYKVGTADNDLADDPLYGVDNTRVTSTWRDPVLARPENALIGIMETDVIDGRPGFPWRLSSQAHSRLLDGTGLQPGQKYGCDLVGFAYDRIFANGASPARLQVLGISPTINAKRMPDVSNTTYYVAPSGAMVFATGSLYWTAGLDNYRFQPRIDPSCPQQSLVVPGLQKLMAHVMDALVVGHPSL